MSLGTILEFNKPEKMKANKILLEIARKVVNSSPEPRYKIKLRDDVLAMKEKERLGFNFNRSVTASLKSRWDVVEKATKDYLQEIVDMNDQIEEDGRKYENQLINLIVTRTTNLGLNSRIEQMAGLFMHMNFYCTVLKFKIQHLEPTRAFMFTCSDLMGFSRPSQIIDRFAALQHVFGELYVDYEARQNLLNHLTETLSEVKAETNHRNMLMHNQMAEMHTLIKQLQTESAQLERAIIDQMEVSTGASLEIYKIKNAVYNIYITMMNYRGLEATQSDSFAQLEELEVRVSHTQAAVKMLQLEETKRQSRKTKLRKKAEIAETTFSGDVVSERSSDYGSESHKSGIEKPSLIDSVNASGNQSDVTPGVMSASVGPKPSKKSNERTVRKLEQVSRRELSLPPIVGKESVAGANHNDTGGRLLLPQLDTNSSKASGRQLSLRMKPEGVAASANKGRTCLREKRSSTSLTRHASAMFGDSSSRDRSRTTPEVVSQRQSRVRRHLVDNDGATETTNVTTIRRQNKTNKTSSEARPGIKIEIKYSNMKNLMPSNKNSNFATDFPNFDAESLIAQLDHNDEVVMDVPTQITQQLKNFTIRPKNAKVNNSKQVPNRSSSLKAINAKRVQLLTEIASRRNLKKDYLNILAKVKL